MISKALAIKIHRYLGSLYLRAVGVYQHDRYVYWSEVRKGFGKPVPVKKGKFETSDSSIESVVARLEEDTTLSGKLLIIPWHFTSFCSERFILQQSELELNTLSGLFTETYQQTGLNPDNFIMHLFIHKDPGRIAAQCHLISKEEMENLKNSFPPGSYNLVIANGLRYFPCHDRRFICGDTILCIKSDLYWDLLLIENGKVCAQQVLDTQLLGILISQDSKSERCSELCLKALNVTSEEAKNIKLVKIDLCSNQNAEERYSAATGMAIGILDPENPYDDEPFYPSTVIAERAFKVLGVLSGLALLVLALLSAGIEKLAEDTTLNPSREAWTHGMAQDTADLKAIYKGKLLHWKAKEQQRIAELAVSKILTEISGRASPGLWLTRLRIREDQEYIYNIVLTGVSLKQETILRMLEKIKKVNDNNARLSYLKPVKHAGEAGDELYKFEINYRYDAIR